MGSCGWCGKMLNGKPVSNIKGKAMVINNGKTEIELMPGYKADFCCHGCAWAFSAEIHRLIGLSGNTLRTHLIDMHGFNYPPGKPEGVMRDDCLIIDMACNLASMFD